MADDEVLDDDATLEVPDGDEEEEDFEDDLEDVEGLVGDVADIVDGVDLDVDVDDAGEEGALVAAPKKGEEDEEDEDQADPDDVEEDLDTILRDRIAAGADEDDEDDDDVPVDQPDGGDRVAPRAAEEHSCPECFLLVRRSQFGTRRTDCPGGLDGEDCPMKKRFA